jgi:hypothetical protein
VLDALSEDQSEEGIKTWNLVQTLMAARATRPIVTEVRDSALRISPPGGFVAAAVLVQALEEERRKCERQ